MPSKFQFYSTLAEHVTSGITATRETWTHFLNSAAWLYKYPFQDQLMIYAQRPDATACAELEFWNEKFGRWVRRGAKGIALIDDTGSYPRLKYVFDVSDTEPSMYRTKPVALWEMRDEHIAPVVAEFAKNYEDINTDDPLDDVFHNIALQLVREYYEDNKRDIFYRSENSALEPSANYDFAGTLIENADDTALQSVFERTLAVSVAYTVMLRCGLDPSEYFDDEDFEEITSFNTADMVNALGVASSILSEQVLRDIEITIRKYERNKNAERSENEHDRDTDLHASRGLSSPQPETERVPEGTDGAAGQVREDEENIPQRPQTDIVQPTSSDGTAIPASEGDRRSGGDEVVGADGDPDGEGEPARQSGRPDTVDSGDEHAESTGGGNGTERTGVQLNQAEGADEKPAPISLPEEDPPGTFSQLGKSSIEDILSASPITMSEVDTILRDGTNEDNGILRIAAYYAKGLDNNADFLKREYLMGRFGRSIDESGKGFDFNGKKVSAWFTDEGIKLAVGNTVNSRRSVLIPWEAAAARIDELFNAGLFISRDTLDEALHNESKELASDVIEVYLNISRSLWDIQYELRQAMTKEQRNATENDWKERRYLIRGLTELDGRADVLLSGGEQASPDEIMRLYQETISVSDVIPKEWHFDRLHPDMDERVTELIHDKGETGGYVSVLYHLQKDIVALDDEPDAPIRFYRNPHRVQNELEIAGLPAHDFPNADIPPANFTRFITQDEIDAALTPYEGRESKYRYLSFFLNDHNDKEKADFVKHAHGTGGGTYGAINGWRDYEPGKGLTLRRNNRRAPEATVTLNWNTAARRIGQLIDEGRFVTRAELDNIQNYERLMLVRTVKNFFYNLPEDYKRPFSEDLDFYYPHEEEWDAINNFLDDEQRVDAVLAQMETVYVNTPEEDRYYNTRKAGFEALMEWREGTYTLFPGIENMPDPETAALQQAATLDKPRNEMIEDMREPSLESFIFGEPAELEQMSLFGESPLPVLPSAHEQQEQIIQQFQALAMMGEPEARQEPETEAQAPVFFSESLDAVLLDVSEVERALIISQFDENPRSRKAAELVRDIYGDRLDTPMPQIMKRIAELIDDGKFNEFDEPYSMAQQVRNELLLREIVASDELINDGLEEYAARGGNGNAEDISDFIEDEFLSEEPEQELDISEPETEREAEPLSDAKIDELVERDWDSETQTILDRVMDDPDYIEALADAQNRSSLRNPCTWALEKTIRAHQDDEPHIYNRYFNDDDFNDELFNYVLRQSWELRPSEQEQFTEITDPAIIAEVDAIFGESSGELVAETTELNREENAVVASIPAVNFRITDDHLGEGGAKTKYRANIAALQTLKQIEADNRNATPEEQDILSRYVGWGGLPEAFDSDNDNWTNEYAELSALLTPEEWQSAKASTLNAHYTSPTVIKAIYETVERLGFRSGNVLEPACGVGNFFGLLPESMQYSRLYGAELDSVTARIAKQLYPRANIQETAYEKTQYPDAFFDIAIGNVPFGGYGVVDSRYKTNFKVHDYFFQKTLDKVRPGGIIAFITSKGTLDKRNPEARRYIAQRAELLGAVRLPNNAFLKNAGTEATTDILILQKRDRPIDIEPEWVHLGTTDDGLPVNRYFLDNPEMMLGKMSNDAGTRMYGSETNTTCVPIEGADLSEQLKTALSYIQGEYTIEELDDLDGVDDHAIPADPDVKNFSYTIAPSRDGMLGADTVYFRENSLMYPVDLPETTLGRIRGMIKLRECVNKLIELQVDEHSDYEIKAQQAVLNTVYDSFVAEYGLISSNVNSRAFNADSAYYLLASLEVLNEDGELERKADMFTKRTIKQKTVITHCDTATEALAVSIGEKARVDMDYMSSLTGKSEAELFEELRGVIFLDFDPNGDSDSYVYRTADEFLSGNVREKLSLYKNAMSAIDENFEHYQAFLDNIEALTAIQPKDLEAGEIGVRLGSTWIDPDYVQQFMYELLGTTHYNQRVYQVKYHPFTGEWQVTGKGRAQYSDIPATVTFGTKRMNAYQIIDDTLNLRDVRVYDMVEDNDGKERRVLNKKETTLAQQKQEVIKQRFKDWLWSDPERRQTLVTLYNERFNSVRPREYDGSHITFSGISPEIKLEKHQVDGVARQMYGGNTLYAHVVGAGKTFTMIASAMESKRLGLCQKSLISVPNHLTEQWASEFLRLYPSANILVATKRDFEMRNRKKFCAKIATGDYDAVIIGHTQLEKIPMSRERQERMINEQIWEIEEGIHDLERTNGDKFSIKQLEKTKRSLNVRLTKLLDAKKRDDVVTFEQLGVDRLYVDEAHNFKNLFLYTKMRNVAGLSTSEAQKSSDLFMKCRYMDEITDNKGVIFATGTPISNSMSELYTMQRYLQYDTLVEKNLIHFDAWASIFGETVTSIELAPEGTGYRARTRFAKFHNLPELMAMFKEVADIQTADMLNLPVPEARYENIIVEPSDMQKEMVQELSERAHLVQARLVNPTEDNMLKITTDGRKIGLDQRLMNPLLPDFEGSKVNACTDKVFEIWSDTKPNRLTQLVFCDFSTPSKETRFNVYDDIKKKLITRGIPEHEIAFIHDADTETKKKELFARVRQGKVRVLFGSTFKMGAGTNVQDKLIAIHDADCPWRPADLEQRSGRIIRQGNTNPEVQIYRYATSGTFDSYLWQTVQKKQEFIAQIISSKSPVRSCEDVDETALSYAEIKALCAGNPLIAEKMQLDNEVAKLRMLKAEHKSQCYRLEDNLLKKYPEQIASVTERIAGIEKDMAMYALEKAKHTETHTGLDGSAQTQMKFPGMVINGVAYTEKEPAAKALLESCAGVKGKGKDVPIGEYMGFEMSLHYESFTSQISMMLRGVMTYQIVISTDAFGNITRINNALDKLPERLQGAKDALDNLNRQVEAAKVELAKPFEQEQELEQKEARLALLNADLNIDGDGGMEMLGENDNRSRDDDEFTEDVGQALDEMGVKYTVAYSPYGISENARVPSLAPAKAKPSILESVRNFDSTKHNDAPGIVKPPEHHI